MRLGVDRGGGVERIREPVGARGRRHELGDPLRAGRRDRERVEVRLCHQLGGEQCRGYVPAARGGGDRVAIADRDEGRKAGARPTPPSALPVDAATRSPSAEHGVGSSVEAEVPRLPCVALHEAEPACVRRQPRRRRRAGPRSSSVAQRCSERPRRRDPSRVRVCGEQRRLLGVGAEAGVDDQRQSGGRRRRGQAVEGRRRRRAASAFPGGRRAGPSSRLRSRSPADRPRRAAHGRHRLRLERATTGTEPAAPAGVQIGARPSPGPEAGANEPASGKSTSSRPRPTPLRAAASAAAADGALEIGGLVEVSRVRRPARAAGRREQALEVVSHRARCRERRQVGGALGARGARDRAAERREQQRAAGRERAIAPSTSGSAWPRSPRARPRAMSPRRRARRRSTASPPGSMPASARRVATRPGARDATRDPNAASRSSRAASAASDRCAGRSARRSTARGRSCADSSSVRRRPAEGGRRRPRPCASHASRSRSSQPSPRLQA